MATLLKPRVAVFTAGVCQHSGHLDARDLAGVAKGVVEEKAELRKTPQTLGVKRFGGCSSVG
jgi:hypothetical protein